MSAEGFHEVLVFPTWRELARRLPRLLVGIPCLGIGIAMMVRARLGLSPYDVLHQGVARRTGLSIGVVIILVGLGVLLLWIPLRQRFGIGTLINTLTAGLCANAALAVIEPPEVLAARTALLVGGVVVTAFGMGLYISAGLGPGPRDGLMTGIAARGYRLWVVRTALELTALGIGWVLGGDIGLGTVLFAFSIGPLGHFFLTWLHLGRPGEPEPDLGPGTAAE
ncbi:MAG TPA: hypothetical protein VFF40_07385 [Acidimicrobiia bacterium]|nr:hypothetical protein [Acidimicrobiia bacterium]